MQKARRHPLKEAPTACMHTVSGSLSLAARRSFHLSLTVLFTIGHELVFSLGGWSPQIQAGFHVPRPTRVPQQVITWISRTGLSPSPVRRSNRLPLSVHHRSLRPHNPGSEDPVWALPISLAATLGISIDFSSSRYLDVSVPWVGSLSGDGISLPPGFPIQTSPDHRLLAAPRGFSQLATSFIAGSCLGIHPVHLSA